MIPFFVVAAAYLIGAIPFGYLVVRLRSGQDVRMLGSGNIGATNVLRTTGRGLGLLTLALDIAKGTLAVWLADYLMGGSMFWMTLAALAVIAGHAFPVFLRFRGGKAVASFIGAFLYLTPAPLLATVLLVVITIAVSRHVSLGSIVGAGLFPLALWIIEHPPGYVIGAAVISGAFIIYRHRENIERLRAGNENVLSFGSRRH
jgi:glycerol-3-phosphate acyltransferase PlsY